MMPQTGASLRQIATVLYGNRNSGRVNCPHTDVTPHFDALLAENSLISKPLDNASEGNCVEIVGALREKVDLDLSRDAKDAGWLLGSRTTHTERA
eukprot:6602465-Pyramimonas_sp.AAC.1